jgi:5-methylcytosine-specific restriction endonuclease McrA
MSNSYGGANCKNAVWEKGEEIKGKNPDMYRRDADGHTIYKSSYGKDTKMGWNIDHIKPQSKGGSHGLRNLQPMQSSANKSYGNKTTKPSRHK